MKVGTKSILWGVHCFFVHPLLVAMAWKRLYGFPWDPRLWVAFFVHDLGYWGKPNMDGPEGETHPELGGRIMGRLFDKKGSFYRYTFDSRKNRYIYYQYWSLFTVTHSRSYAYKLQQFPSKLCAADKLAFCFEPYWLYMLRALISGEIKEYLKIRKYLFNNSHSRKHWFNSYRRHMLRWTAENYRRL